MKARLQRVAIVAAMGVVTLNIWTGAPLLGLWVGSRVAPESGISMFAVLVIVVVIGATRVGAAAASSAGSNWPTPGSAASPRRAARRRG